MGALGSELELETLDGAAVEGTLEDGGLGTARVIFWGGASVGLRLEEVLVTGVSETPTIGCITTQT